MEETIIKQDENGGRDVPEKPGSIALNGFDYYPYTTQFTSDAGKEEDSTFYFRRPQRVHMVMLSGARDKKAYDAQREVLSQLVVPSQRHELLELFDTYVALVGSFGDEVFKNAGAGSVFAGK